MSNRGRILVALALVAALGCGDDDEPVAEPEPRPEAQPEPEPAAPLSCALEGEPLLLPDVAGPTAIAPVGDAFVVASFARTEEGGEDLWFGRVAPGAAAEELAEVSITESEPERHPNAAPALATIDAQTVGVAVVGRRGAVSAGRLELAAEPALKLAPVEGGARRTDPPAVAPARDGLAVAWTQASTYVDPEGHGYFCGFGAQFEPAPSPPPEPTHGHQVRLAMIDADGTVHTRRDATPRVDGAQAVAPVVIDGADPPALLFLDPRAGIGAVHRVGVRAGGFVEPEIARPLSNLRDQTDVAAAAGPGGPWLAYSAIGNGATTAIGLVSLANTEGPVPLVPGTDHQPLHVAAAAIGDAAVFAAEAPKGADRSRSKEIRVRAVNAAGPGEPLVLRDDSEAVELDAEPQDLAPSARLGRMQISGSLGAEVVERVIRDHLDDVRRCHAQGLEREPGLQGRMTVRFVVSPSGRVRAALSQSSQLGDPAVEACITRVVRQWTFPEPEGGGIVVVTCPFLLRRDGGEPLDPGWSLLSAFAPAIAARESDGLLAVAYSTAAGVRVAWVRCR